MYALNDAVRIQPNYPVGDDNEPTFTAPSNKPDIECFYDAFNLICEVTMLRNRDQWYNEGQPVMRHLRDFEDLYPDKPAYCIFIAPSLHRDTMNTFWAAIKMGYEGRPQRIIPLTTNQFAELLVVLSELIMMNSIFSHIQLRRLFDAILEETKDINDSRDWIKKIPAVIAWWSEQVKSEPAN